MTRTKALAAKARAEGLPAKQEDFTGEDWFNISRMVRSDVPALVDALEKAMLFLGDWTWQIHTASCICTFCEQRRELVAAWKGGA